MAAEGKSCGECGLCCKVFEIPALPKPVHTWCGHYKGASGCGIYANRPEACRAFECGYLQNPALGPEWRPDRAGFLMYFSQPGPRLHIVVDDEATESWRREPYLSQLREWARRDAGFSIEVVVREGDEVTMIFPEAAVLLGKDPGLPIRSGYRIEDGKRVPFAEFAHE